MSGSDLEETSSGPPACQVQGPAGQEGSQSSGEEEPRGGRHKAEVKAEGPWGPWNAGQAWSPAGEPGMGLLPSEGQQRGFFFDLVLKFQTPASLLRP